MVAQLPTFERIGYRQQHRSKTSGGIPRIISADLLGLFSAGARR